MTTWRRPIHSFKEFRSPGRISNVTLLWKVDDARCALDPSIVIVLLELLAHRLDSILFKIVHTCVLTMIVVSHRTLQVGRFEEPARGSKNNTQLGSSGLNLNLADEVVRKPCDHEIHLEVPDWIVFIFEGVDDEGFWGVNYV